MQLRCSFDFIGSDHTLRRRPGPAEQVQAGEGMTNPGRRAYGRLSILGRLVCLAGIALLSGCIEAGVLHPAGEVAARQRAHLMTIILWMLPVIVPVFLALPLIAWRYRIGGRGVTVP
ncbi:hypothetical protein ATO1_22020 [Phaeobacter sp. 22II1-1F12B]|nr:hypothetical protein ATO1_22020 [Phaeobacter sp. 22II1-1F12B]